MNRRFQAVNIPTELLRTFDIVVDCNSYSKAALKLGLSQPAITSHMRRLQILSGGQLFEFVAGRMELSPRGKTLLPYARRILEANDQILAIGGAIQDSKPIRFGLSNYFADAFMRGFSRHEHGDTVIMCDNSDDLLRGLDAGYLDLACVLNPGAQFSKCLEVWDEPFAWVRSRNFVLSPGAAVPLVGCPGLIADRLATKALETTGLAYRLVFSSSDHHSRLAATVSGVGVMAMPARMVTAPLELASEYYLPHLENVQAGLCVREGYNVSDAAKVVELVDRYIKPHSHTARPVVACAGG